MFSYGDSSTPPTIATSCHANTNTTQCELNASLKTSCSRNKLISACSFSLIAIKVKIAMFITFVLLNVCFLLKAAQSGRCDRDYDVD